MRWICDGRYMTGEILARAREIESMLTGAPGCTGVSIDDRAFWRQAGERFDSQSLLARASQALDEPYPVMTEDIYLELEYGVTKPQADKLLFSSMRLLEQAVLAECLENQGRFLPYIEHALESICQRRSLVRPGHDAAFDYSDYRGGHGQIDLYSSSLGWRLAVVDMCLGDRLSSALRQRVKEKIDEKVLAVFAQRLQENPEEIMIHNAVPLYWVDGFDNWTAVCLSGVICTGLYWGTRQEQALLIALYETRIRRYLQSLPDGYCTEGLGYWGYGFGKFITAADLIWRMTGGQVDLYAQEDFLRAARFGRSVGICTDVYPSVSDCCFGTRPLDFCVDYLHLREEGTPDMVRHTPVNPRLDLCIVMMMLNWDHRQSSTIAPPDSVSLLRTWYEHQSMLIARDLPRDLGLYIQGGHNHMTHNHNDVGSFIIGAHGETFVCDPGFSVYDRFANTNRRYEKEVLSSLGHSVPRVAGQLQGPKEFCAQNLRGGGENGSYEAIRFQAQVLEKSFHDHVDRLILDLTQVYEVPGLLFLHRCASLDRVSGIIEIRDDFAFSQACDFESAIVTYLPLRLTPDGHVLIQGEKSVMEMEILAENYSLDLRCIKDAYVGDKDIPAHPLRLAVHTRAQQGSVTLRFRWQA